MTWGISVVPAIIHDSLVICLNKQEEIDLTLLADINENIAHINDKTPIIVKEIIILLRLQVSR